MAVDQNTSSSDQDEVHTLQRSCRFAQFTAITCRHRPFAKTPQPSWEKRKCREAKLECGLSRVSTKNDQLVLGIFSLQSHQHQIVTKVLHSIISKNSDAHKVSKPDHCTLFRPTKNHPEQSRRVVFIFLLGCLAFFSRSFRSCFGWRLRYYFWSWSCFRSRSRCFHSCFRSGLYCCSFFRHRSFSDLFFVAFWFKQLVFQHVGLHAGRLPGTVAEVVQLAASHLCFLGQFDFG